MGMDRLRRPKTQLNLEDALIGDEVTATEEDFLQATAVNSGQDGEGVNHPAVILKL